MNGEEVDPDAVRKQELDGSQLPENFAKSIAPYLGAIGTVVEAEENGWRISGCILKKKQVSMIVKKPEDADEIPNR